MAKVIAISGKAQNGKDTTGKIIKDALEANGKSAIIMHYADVLKFVCTKYYEWDGNKDEKGRELLQRIGTNVFRENNPNVWVDILISLIKGIGDSIDYVIICDARFENEVNCFKENNIDSISIRVERPNFDNGLTEEQKQHISETQLDNYEFNFTLINDKDIDNLKLCVASVVNKILKCWDKCHTMNTTILTV